MTRVAQITFGVLVLATGAAFFVTQRLKRSPPLVLASVIRPGYLSPRLAPGPRTVRISFRLKQADDVSVSIVTGDGDQVRTLALARAVGRGRRFATTWDGRDDDGRVVRDGFYRVRLGLRREGRTVTLFGGTRVDTTAPTPVITSVADRATRTARLPLILPAGRATSITVGMRRATARQTRLFVARTDGPRSRVVSDTSVRAGRFALRWDGTVNGAPAPPGVYALRLRAKDLAGNVGLSPARGPGIGVTVRAVAAQVPLAPVVAGRRAAIFVDARGRSYTWELRRAGGTKVVARGTGHGVTLAVRPPTAGLDVLAVRAGEFTARAPLPVVSPGGRRARVLVVLPGLRWQALDAVDDDGDGTPNTLDRGQRAPLVRPLTELPAGFATVTRLLAHLDRLHARYDVTTDAALAVNLEPALAGHAGVLLAGPVTWVPPALGERLRSYVAGGGRLALFDPETLRRSVRLDADVLSAPGPLTAQDVLGARLDSLVRRRVDITVFRNGASLFDTVGGLFPNWPVYEAVRSFRPARELALAGPDPRTPVISAAALGHGLVVRVGLPGWFDRLDRDTSVTELTDQAWRLLSR